MGRLSNFRVFLRAEFCGSTGVIEATCTVYLCKKKTMILIGAESYALLSFPCMRLVSTYSS